MRIIMATADRLKMPIEKVIINIDRYGNTTAGTIPLAMQTAIDEGKLKKGLGVCWPPSARDSLPERRCCAGPTTELFAIFFLAGCATTVPIAISWAVSDR